tara:strand:+ start:49 stop:423 length:375 start_codon:yes stop_codon:yes gene_type:complete
MKITKSKLQQLIKEELNAVLREQVYQDDVPATQHPTSKAGPDVEDRLAQLENFKRKTLDILGSGGEYGATIESLQSRIKSLENHVKANWKALQQNMEKDKEDSDRELYADYPADSAEGRWARGK